MSILEVRGGFEKTIKAVNKFHNNTRSLSDFRNRVLHDGWATEASTGIPHRLQVTANKTLVYGYEATTTETLVEKAGLIADAIDSFKEIINPAIERFPPLSLP